MAKAWEKWGDRFKALAGENGYTLAKLADELSKLQAEGKLPERDHPRKWAESTLRSWTNGTRDINLSDFFLICQVARVSASNVLFNAPLMNKETTAQISDAVARVLDADPATTPNYAKAARRMRTRAKA